MVSLYIARVIQYCWNRTVPGFFSSTRSSIVKMTARSGKGYIQKVWWINKHECSIPNVFLWVIAVLLSGTFKSHKIGMGFWDSFLVQGFFWGFAGSPRDSLGLDCWLHSIIPATWNPECPHWGMVKLNLRSTEQRRNSPNDTTSQLKKSPCAIQL